MIIYIILLAVIVGLCVLVLLYLWALSRAVPLIECQQQTIDALRDERERAFKLLGADDYPDGDLCDWIRLKLQEPLGPSDPLPYPHSAVRDWGH